MYKIGLQMLTQDKAKFIGLILSLSFSALIITQQTAIFFGIMMRTYSTITDTPQAEIWVMDPNVQHIDDVNPLRDTDLYRIRSIDGVEWAVPLFKGLIRARLPDGHYQTCILQGVDDATFIGGPCNMLQGSLYDLRAPDAVIIDDYELDKLSFTRASSPVRPEFIEGASLEHPVVGDTLELNDRRAVIVGISRLTRTFLTYPIIYTTYNRALFYAPYERKLLSFVLVKANSTTPAEQLCETIHTLTGLQALTKQQFENKTISYYLHQTGIGVNFGLTILFGILIGAALAGQIFFSFVVSNLAYLALLSVLGASKRLLAQITIIQALWVALLSWHIGTGAAAAIGFATQATRTSFYMPLSLYLATGLIIFIICFIASLIAISKIYKIELGELFKQ